MTTVYIVLMTISVVSQLVALVAVLMIFRTLRKRKD